MKKITVIGSISTDLVFETALQPKIGETVEGTSMELLFGGKGANQAVAASRLNTQVTMIGSVGEDAFGDKLIQNLHENNIDSTNVKRVPQSSGTALIQLIDGDNSIIYIPGANNEIYKEDLDKCNEIIKASDMVLVQNEIPEIIVNYIIDYCYENKVKILLNPAPARLISRKQIEKINFLTPNETEFDVIFSGKLMEDVLQEYPNKLIVTRGVEGVFYHDGNQIINVPAYRVTEVVDTTGAGDCFNGSFASALVNGLKIEEALKFANLAASISIRKKGAQSGSPTIDEIKGSEYFEEEWNFK